MTEVKICGLSRMADIEAVNQYRPDYAGFVFYEKSKRNVSIAQADMLLHKLDPSICSVAVCVSPTPDFVKELMTLPIRIIQIHGTIDPAVLELVDRPVWQAINVASPKQLDGMILHPKITGYVVDGEKYGGGKTFEWKDPIMTAGMKKIKQQIRNGKLILAGGLQASNVKNGISIFAPDIVDVSSGVETDDYKDSNKIKMFIEEVRSYE